MTDEKMEIHTFASVWDAVEDTPHEAQNMKLRSGLMMALEQAIRERGLTQAQAAKVLGVTQPRVSALMKGKINLFGLDTLINMAVALGLQVQMQIHAAVPAGLYGRPRMEGWQQPVRAGG